MGGRPSSAWWAALLLLVAVVSLGCDGRSTPPPIEPTKHTNTTFEPGDQFSVDVFGEETLTGDFQVQNDGTIDFPLIGRLDVNGMTQSELAKELETRLADGYLRDPQVKVRITARENVEISVLGQVAEPGTFSFVENLTIVQAISEAGGMTPYAASGRVKLIRKTIEGPQTFEVSVKDIIESRAKDMRLVPGDIVFVPESAL
jgi:protein involved in polysaccharide export with SLBB domain